MSQNCRTIEHQNNRTKNCRTIEQNCRTIEQRTVEQYNRTVEQYNRTVEQWNKELWNNGTKNQNNRTLEQNKKINAAQAVEKKGDLQVSTESVTRSSDIPMLIIFIIFTRAKQSWSCGATLSILSVNQLDHVILHQHGGITYTFKTKYALPQKKYMRRSTIFNATTKLAHIPLHFDNRDADSKAVFSSAQHCAEPGPHPPPPARTTADK